MPDYGVRELADALVSARKWRNAAPDIRDYHQRRLNAIQTALGVDGERGQPRESDSLALSRLMNRTIDMLERDKSPFNAFMDTPEGVIALQQAHAPAIGKAVDELNSALLSLLVDLLVTLYAVPTDVTVSDEDLRHFGFDPGVPAPDPLDYW